MFFSTTPYNFLHGDGDWIVIFVLTATTFLVSYLLGKQGKCLINEKAPYGIISIELPWNEKRALEIVESWKDGLIPVAKKQVLWDFLFLLLYPLTLSIACALLARYFSGMAGFLGVTISWAVLLAAPLDAVENISILKMLSASIRAPIPQIASISATIKFILVFIALGYIVTALIHWMISQIIIN